MPAPSAFAESDLPTVDAVIEEKRKQVKAKAESAAPAAKQTTSEKPAAETQKQPSSEAAQNTAALEGGPAALEEEAGQEGAFNPETGEINWDCPCLGGMAHGPCGEEFKTAFSCFVYSNEEPKGMDCIEKFQYVDSGQRWHGERNILTDSTGACRSASESTPRSTAPS